VRTNTLSDDNNKKMKAMSAMAVIKAKPLLKMGLSGIVTPSGGRLVRVADGLLMTILQSIVGCLIIYLVGLWKLKRWLIKTQSGAISQPNMTLFTYVNNP